jgi:hypothetical protein
MYLEPSSNKELHTITGMAELKMHKNCTANKSRQSNNFGHPGINVKTDEMRNSV